MSDEPTCCPLVIMSMQGKLKTHFPNDCARRSEKSLSNATGLSEIDFSLVEVAPRDESTEIVFRNKNLTWNMVDQTVIDRPFGAKT